MVHSPVASAPHRTPLEMQTALDLLNPPRDLCVHQSVRSTATSISFKMSIDYPPPWNFSGSSTSTFPILLVSCYSPSSLLPPFPSPSSCFQKETDLTLQELAPTHTHRPSRLFTTYFLLPGMMLYHLGLQQPSCNFKVMSMRIKVNMLRRTEERDRENS